MAVTDLAGAPRRRPGHAVVRGGPFALRINYRVLLLTLVAFVLLLLLAAWAMSLGSFHLPLDAVARAVFGAGDQQQNFIVRTLRLPRVICAILIGAALALSGAIFQGLVRNPLVSPDVIGIDRGATVFAVFWIVTGRSPETLPIAAFIGSLLTAGIIYILSWRGGVAPNRLILVGIGISSIMAAGTTYLTVRFPIEQVRAAVVWATGSVYGTNWASVRSLLITLVVLLPAALLLSRYLRPLSLGDDVARGLGMPLERARLALLFVGCGLAAVTVAVAGPIGFVALMVPHIARMLVGPLSGSMLLFTGVLGGLFLLFTGVLGGLFLLFADVVAQHFLPVQLPVGVVTSAIGAPYFLFLLYRSNVRM